ncbi:MAG: type VI secretion system tube protein Hcp [Phycisphaeraceae bacterium]|nr:type VI secretion system tube protein Hcp [Phycisphaeraceae bacterium]
MPFDAFLKVSTIPGESTDDKHKDWIEILSFSHGLTQQISGVSVSTGGGRSGQRCDHGDFSIVKALDKATPKLNLACSNGEHIPTVEVTLNRAAKDKTEYYRFKFEDVLVTRVAIGGSAQGGEGLPLEDVSFAYGKVTWTYQETDHKTGAVKGKVESWWDLHSNKGA